MTDLPQGWREVRLGEVADVLDSKRKPVNSKERAGRAGSVPYYGATGQVGTIDTHLFDEELVLLGEDGAPFLDLAKPKAYLISGKSWVNNHAHVLRCREGAYTNTLLVHFLNDLNYLPYVNGTTRLKLTQGSMNEIPVTVPPLAEQERIVEILEEKFSRLDSALDSIKAVREKAKAFRRSLLHAAFNGELTGGTEGWREVALGEVCRVYQPKTISTKELMDDGEYVVFGANGVIGRYDKFNHEESEVTVTCRGATCGTVNVTSPKAWITGNAMVCKPNDESLTKPLLALLLRSVDFTSVITGTAQPQITRSTLAPLLVRVPPLAEQERIVSLLEEQFSRLDKALEVANQLEARIASERRSLLHSAFTGELTSQWRKTHV